MASIYFKADSSVVAVVNEAIKKWHPELSKAQIQIGILFAVSGKDDQPAIKEAGHPVDGIIKIVTLKDRVTKGFDAEMILDGDSWKQMGDDDRLAFIDHLLSRLELKKPKKKKDKKNDAVHGDDEEQEEFEESEFLQDDIGRPVLKTRKWDWNAGFGFREVVERHGAHAPECHHLNHAKSIVDSAMKQKPAPQE
jgi:hypothetical protein